MNKRGKITLSVIIVLILLVSFSLYSILGVPENVKNYDAETKTVTINIGATEVAKLKLNTPQVYNVVRGKDRLVAEFTIENNIDNYPDFFQNMEFYDIKDSMKKFDREFTFKYKEFYNLVIDEYEKICSEREINNATGSFIEKYNCYQNKIGQHNETRFNWINLNKNAILQKGDITIGIFTDVYSGDHVEWIPTLFGVKIDEWAEWQESLNTEIFAYYTFNQTTGNIIDNRIDGAFMNLTFGGSQTFVTGKIGNAIDLNNGNKAQPGWWLANVSGFTINFWANQTADKSGDSGDSGIAVTGNVNSEGDIYLVWRGNLVFGQLYNGGAKVLQGANINDNQWNMITFMINSSILALYINGAFNESIALSSFSFPGGDYPLAFFNDNGNTIPIDNVLIDEMGIWNRTLTDEEIDNLYNNGTGNTYTPAAPDTTAPTWKDNWTDASNLTKNGETVHFNITLEDNIEGGNWIFSFYNGITWANNSGTWAGVNHTILNETRTITAIKNQEVRWKWYFNDSIGNNNETPIWSFTVANSPPNHTTPLLSTLSGKNFSYENLTCYNQSTSDADNDAVVNIYNWYKNSQPLSVLNMPFEGSSNSTYTKDYSNYDNDGNVVGASWNSTAGKIGGAYEFDGVDDYIEITNFVNAGNEITLSSWIYPTNTTGPDRNIVGIKRAGGGWLYGLVVYYGNLAGAIYGSSDGSNCANPTVGGGVLSLPLNTWAHVTMTFNNATNQVKFYKNGELGQTVTWYSCGGNSEKVEIASIIHNWYSGTIDEIKIYPYALSSEQIKQNYEETKDGLTSSSKIVSQETTAGDNYMCQITPNDAEEDGVTLNSSTAEIKWAITFNVTDSYYGTSLNNVLISCNYSEFSQAPYTTNPYGPYGFEPGSYSCTFEQQFDTHFEKTITFIADADKTIEVAMSSKGELTVEEHTWLEAIYNCLYLGDCGLYNLLLEMNQTVGKIWEHTKPTDESVIAFENITNKVVNSSNNLTIDYSVNIPIKAGYSLGTYLPVRIGYWFLDINNETCYDQGDKPTGVEGPYCQPLIIETIGPMGGQVNFTVESQPSLPSGNYSIKRIIDIDPNNVWINYGQELISSFVMAETLSTYGIGIEKTGEATAEKEGLLKDITSKITGAVTGEFQTLLSGWQIVAIITVIGLVLITSIISRTIIKLKKK